MRGAHVDHYLLWGVNILWWGRLGKIVQCLGGLTIIAEIIGPNRLRAFGQSLHSKFTLASASSSIRNSFAWCKLFFRYMFLMNDAGDLDKALIEMRKFNANVFTRINLFVLAAATSAAFWLNGHEVLAVILFPVFVVIYGIFIAPIVTVVIFTSMSLIGLLIDTVLIEPIALVLDREYLDKLVKVVGILMLIIGFHFDLLSS